VTWTASTDNVGVTGYGAYRNAVLAGSPTATSYTFTGLACGTSYTLGVDAADAAGNRSGKAAMTASTSACSDTQAPSAPTGLVLSSSTVTSISVTWAASTDNVGVAGYGAYKNAVLAGSPTATSYTFAGLACGTSYTLGVDAVDAAGNRSAQAATSLSTSACTDTTPPSTPTGAATSGVGQTSLTLSWTASSDNVGVTGYRLYQNGTQVGTSLSTSYLYGGLACGTSYTLGLAAVDAAGNVSGTATLSGSTSACSTGGSATANIFVSTVNDSDSCTRSSTALLYTNAAGHICATPAKACQIAQSGDIVILEDGGYSGAMNGACIGHQNFTNNVVFEPEPGHYCPMTYPNVPAPYSDTTCPVHIDLGGNNGQYGGGMSIDGNAGSTCGVSGHPLPDTLTTAQMANWATHVTVKGIYIGDFSAVCAAYIELDNDAGNHWYLGQGVYHWYMIGGDYGNRTDAAQPTIGDSTESTSSSYTSTNWPPAEDIRVENAVIHDFVTYGSGHGDGFFIDPSYNVQLIGNIIARDDCIPLYVNYATVDAQPLGIHGLRIIGNVVHLDTDHNGNGRCFQGISLGNNNQYDTIAAFNSVEMPIRRSNGTEDNQGIRIIGNITSGINAANSGNTAGCGAGTTASYNILTDSSANNCGDSSNLVSAPGQFTSTDVTPNSQSQNVYFTASLGNYALAANVAAIGKVPIAMCQPGGALYPYCPTTDPNGNPRPNPAHPSYYDAGAYENR
jgi:chitodextrinase